MGLLRRAVLLCSDAAGAKFVLERVDGCAIPCMLRLLQGQRARQQAAADECWMHFVALLNAVLQLQSLAPQLVPHLAAKLVQANLLQLIFRHASPAGASQSQARHLKESAGLMASLVLQRLVQHDVGAAAAWADLHPLLVHGFQRLLTELPVEALLRQPLDARDMRWPCSPGGALLLLLYAAPQHSPVSLASVSADLAVQVQIQTRAGGALGDHGLLLRALSTACVLALPHEPALAAPLEALLRQIPCTAILDALNMAQPGVCQVCQRKEKKGKKERKKKEKERD